MLRVPGSSDDLRFHRESLSEEVNIKPELKIESPAKAGLSQTREEEGSPDRQISGRGFDHKKIKEKDRLHDLK